MLLLAAKQEFIQYPLRRFRFLFADGRLDNPNKLLQLFGGKTYVQGDIQM